ncbi:MAG: hypothetical protein E6R04_10945 [Spirochaetes bacterium]|nr:MAG: hypothetical protein E6R04_10945 [Spirochaetota bacterium]
MAKSTMITAASVSRDVNRIFASKEVRNHPFTVKQGTHTEIQLSPTERRIDEFLVVLRRGLHARGYQYTVRKDIGKVLVSSRTTPKLISG